MKYGFEIKIKIGNLVEYENKTWLVFDVIETQPANGQWLTCIEYHKQKEVNSFDSSNITEVIELPSNVKPMFFGRIKRCEEKYLGEKS